MAFFGNQTLAPRVERRDHTDDAGELLHAGERRADDSLKRLISGNRGLRLENNEILLGKWLVEASCEDLLGAIGVGAENIERGAGDRRLKAWYQKRACNQRDNPDRDDEPVKARQHDAKPVERGESEGARLLAVTTLLDRLAPPVAVPHGFAARRTLPNCISMAATEPVRSVVSHQ